MIRTKSMTLDVIVQHCWGTVGECGCFGSDKLEVCLQIAIHPRDTFSGGVTTLGNSLLGKSVMPVMDLVMHNTCVCTIGHAPLGMSKDLMNYKFTCLIMFVDPKNTRSQPAECTGTYTTAAPQHTTGSGACVTRKADSNSITGQGRASLQYIEATQRHCQFAITTRA